MHVAISSKVLDLLCLFIFELMQKQVQNARADALQLEIDDLQVKLGYSPHIRAYSWLNVFRVDVDAEKIVKRHITLLHRYNEAKDATQVRRGLLRIFLMLIYSSP